MKTKLVAVVFASMIGATAHAQNPGSVNGALIGGALGYVFGDGSGHQKEIAAGSAVAGALLGGHVYNARSYNREYYPVGREYYHSEPYYRRPYSGAIGYCESRLPYQYRDNAGAARSWVNGCMNRLQQEQRILEQEAYRSGANDF